VTTNKNNWAELLMGLGIVVVGAVMAWQATTIKVIPLYAKVGPAAFLWFAAGLLLLCGLIVAVRALRLPPVDGNEIAGPLVILAGLAASVLLMDRIGFIPTATMVFTLTAFGLGSRSLLRDAGIGLVLAALAFVVFGMGLGLRLPLGSLFS
jgi:putative tricarboxylic transport membrane protein